MKMHILTNVMEFQILGITISALLFNGIMSKYDAAGKSNIYIINNKIEDMDLKIKRTDIDQFHEHVNHMTTELESQSMIIPDLIHQFFQVIKYFEESYFREYLIEIERKIICEEVGLIKYTETDPVKNALTKYNLHKLDEVISWGYLSGTDKEILVLIS